MRLGCKGAKDEFPQQDDLKEERWASDIVTSPSLYSLEQGAADEAAEATWKPIYINRDQCSYLSLTSPVRVGVLMRGNCALPLYSSNKGNRRCVRSDLKNLSASELVLIRIIRILNYKKR